MADRTGLIGNAITLLRGLRSTRSSGSVKRPIREPDTRAERWTLILLGLATLVVVIDGIAGQFVVIGFLAVPPIVAAATTNPRSTAVVSGYCVVFAVLSIFWDATMAGQFVIRVLLVSLAGVVSYWNALLREEVVAGARGGAMLAAGTTDLDNQLDEEAIARQLVDSAVPDLANVAIVDLLGLDGSIRARSIAASDPNLDARLNKVRSRLRIELDSGVPAAKVITSGERLLYEEIGDPVMREMAVNERHLAMLREIKPRSMLVVPLRFRDETLGALSLGSLDSGDRYGRGEVAFAEDLASRAAVGLMNARLHSTQSQLARTLQENLLPRALPKVPGLEIAAGFRPAAAGTEVGGDFYDVFQRSQKSWKLVIGDVCGKGPEAAALTSLMRDTLRASALRGETPRESLSLLNAAIIEAGVDGRFCTSAVVRFDLGSPSELTVSNAGHPPPLMLTKAGKVKALGPPGTLLGIFDQIELSDTKVKMKKGDLVMLFTDGLFEVPPGRAGGEVDVATLLADQKGGSAAEVASAIEREVLAAQGDDPQDDIAILVAKRI